MTDFTQLTHRSILAITGEDAYTFLQKCTTNNIDNISNKSFIYNCILNNKGKFIADFFCTQYKDKILLDVPKNALMDIAQYLHKYALGQRVDFHDMTQDFNLWAFWNGEEKLARPDPRLPAMGHRALLPKEVVPAGTANTEEAYLYHRLQCGVPDGYIDGAGLKIYPAELGLDFLNGVSYDKGCYVGQEVTARLHFKTQPKKRIFCVNFEGDSHPHGCNIITNGTVAGVLLSNIHGRGLALLKTRYVTPDALLTVDDTVLTQISLPDYVHLG